MAKKPQTSVKRAVKNTEYDNTNTGVLFKNRKRKNDDHPNMRGSFVDSEGNEFWLSAWSAEHDEYGTYLRLVATPKEDERTTKKGKKVHDTDDLPF